MPSCIPVMTIAMITFPICRAVFILKKQQQYHSMMQKKKIKLKGFISGLLLQEIFLIYISIIIIARKTPMCQQTAGRVPSRTTDGHVPDISENFLFFEIASVTWLCISSLHCVSRFCELEITLLFIIREFKHYVQQLEQS